MQAPISDMHYPAYCTQMELPPQRIRMPARGHNFLFNRLTALFNGMGSDRGARANRRRSCCFSHGRRPYHFYQRIRHQTVTLSAACAKGPGIVDAPRWLPR